MNGRRPFQLQPWQYPRTGQPQPQPQPQPRDVPPSPAEQRQDERFIDRVVTGLSAVTPTLLFTAAGTGFALAIGAGLGSAFMQWLLPARRGRR